jgi:hypothetical protein
MTLFVLFGDDIKLLSAPKRDGKNPFPFLDLSFTSQFHNLSLQTLHLRCFRQ